jgi:glycine hydroxymethyltransferase
MAVYMSLLKPGDKILGLNLAHGGHLTHGSPVNFSGQIYQATGYTLNKETRTLDYNRLKIWLKKKDQNYCCRSKCLSA